MGATRLRLGSLIIVTSLALSAIALTGAPAGADANPCASGCWTAPFSPFGLFDAAPPKTVDDSKKFPAAASAVVLPNGRILYWNGLQDIEDANAPLAADLGRINPRSKTAILDLTGSGAAFYPDAKAPLGHDLFCADQRLNQNGKVVVVGGTNWKSEVANPADDGNGPGGLVELYGSKQTHLFQAGSETLRLNEDSNFGDITTSQWSLGADMAKARWYPTELTLGDGNEFVAGGVGKLMWNSSVLDAVDSDKGGDVDEATNPAPQNVLETETYNADTNTWTLNPTEANVTLPLFARMHLLPNGEIFFGSVGQMWGPAGQSIDQLEWNDYKLLDSHNLAGGWRTDAMGNYGARSGAFSAMLPLKAPYDKVDVLVGGGVLGTSPGTYLSTDISEIVHLAKGENGKFTASAEETSPMNVKRWYSSSVTLPNGQVVAVNGADKDEVVMPGPEAAIRTAELWTGSEWVTLSDGSRDRTYHSSAILLPDGSVLVGGHAPINRYYGDKGAPNDELAPAGVKQANNLKDPSFERLFPPYLYEGARPKVNSSQKFATWGGKLEVQMDPTSIPPAKLVLSRLPSVTHTTDADARTVEVDFEAGNGTTLKASIPDSRDVLPPGFYYLFALSDKGVPSVATVVQVTDEAHYIGGGNATPVEMAAQPFRPAGSSPISSVKAPASGSVATGAIANKSAPVAASQTLPVSDGTDSSGIPAGLLAGLAALGGITLVGRARLGVRVRA